MMRKKRRMRRIMGWAKTMNLNLMKRIWMMKTEKMMMKAEMERDWGDLKGSTDRSSLTQNSSTLSLPKEPKSPINLRWQYRIQVKQRLLDSNNKTTNQIRPNNLFWKTHQRLAIKTNLYQMVSTQKIVRVRVVKKEKTTTMMMVKMKKRRIKCQNLSMNLRSNISKGITTKGLATIA